jgi:hypothetical protein
LIASFVISIFAIAASEMRAKGSQAKGAFLAETSYWTNSYFKPQAFNK